MSKNNSVSPAAFQSVADGSAREITGCRIILFDYDREYNRNEHSINDISAYTEIWSPPGRCWAIFSMVLMFLPNTALLVVDCDSKYLCYG